MYSVFQYNPPAVGFAQLSDYALSLNDNNKLPVPSATIGSVIAQVSNSGTRGTRESSGASGPRNEIPGLSALIVLVMLLRLALN